MHVNVSDREQARTWRTLFGAAENIQRVRPEISVDYLNNPHEGTTTFQRFEGDPLQEDHRWHDDRGPMTFAPAPASIPAPMPNYPPTRISYCRWPWSKLEPTKGQYRFDVIHGALEAAAKRGQTLQIRFEPYVHDDIPDWYKKTGAGIIPTNSVPEIDSNDPLYLKHWSEFVKAIGKQFNGHPNLESVDVAYAGRFGECGGNADESSSKKLVDAYIEAFPETFLLSMMNTHGCRYAASLNRKNIGWRGDGFMDGKYRAPGVVPDGLVWHHMFDEYPRHLHECGLSETWKTAPVSIEPHATLYHLQPGTGIFNLTKDSISADFAWQVEHCMKYHLSTFMAKSVETPAQWMQQFMQFNRRMGYQFYLHQMVLPLDAKAAEAVKVAVTIDNKGLAPIYRPYRFALRFVQDGHSAVVPLRQDIRKWMPDYSYFEESVTLPAQLRQGPARVDCGIINAANEPVVKMHIRAITDGGWHPLTYVNIQ